jgi:hypothetical protein
MISRSVAASLSATWDMMKPEPPVMTIFPSLTGIPFPVLAGVASQE